MSTSAQPPSPEEQVAAPAPEDPHHARRWLILAVILVAQIMILLDTTIVNVALPSAQADLGFSDAARQWVLTAYVLAFGSLLPLGGRLSDVFGRKRTFLVGLVGFAVTSAVAGAAPNIGAFIAARAAQGAFAAVLAPAALSLIAVTFTDRQELNKAIGIFGAASGSASALGLILGGLLTDYASWRWTMYVNIVFAVIGIVGALALMTHSTHPNKPRLSLPSTILSSAGLFGIVFGASKAETDGWGSAVTIGSLVAGAVLLTAFVLLQKYDRHPLIPLRVVLDRNRGGAYLVVGLSNLALLAEVLFLTYYFQTVLGYSPITTGFAFLPLPVAIAITATVAQEKLVKQVSVRTLVVIGLVISAAGAVLLARTGVDTDYAALPLPALILIGAGMGLSVVVAIGIGQQGVDPKDAGTAGAMNNVSQQIGSAIGVAVISTFVATATTDYFTSHPAVPGSAAEATVHGFSVGYWWAAGVYVAAAVICGLLIRPGTYAHHRAGAELDDEAILAIG
ncbi:MFS transporter [Streptomyces sp. NPDC059627]